MSDQVTQAKTQEVFHLRKAGKATEALKLAREALEESPEDVWAVRALAWCLYDEIKKVRLTGDTDALNKIRKELSNLSIPEGEDDRILREQIAYVLDPAPVEEANKLSKEGKHHDAVVLLRPFTTEDTVTRRTGEAYGWILYRKLKETRQEEAHVRFWCLQEFADCWNPEWEPNVMLFKNMLIQAKLHAGNWAGLVPMFEKLELSKLSPDEFGEENENSDFDPFQDQLLGTIYKSLKSHPSMKGERTLLVRWLDAWKDSFGDGEWPTYHRGRILAWVGGNRDEALSLLTKTVQRNPNDFWRWHALAELLEGEEKIAALSRSICCKCQDETFKIPLYKDYSAELAEIECFSEARASLDEVIRLVNLSGREYKDPLPDWYKQEGQEKEIDLKAFAENRALTADGLLARDLPSIACHLIRPIKRDGCFLYYCEGLGIRTLKFANAGEPCLQNRGISAKFNDNPNGVVNVLIWEEKPFPDELLEWTPGIVVRLNTEKELAVVQLSEDDVTILHFDRWPKAKELLPGQFVDLALIEGSNGRQEVLAWKSSLPRRVHSLSISVTGFFKQPTGRPFGFINSQIGRIFVAPDEAKGLVDGQQVEGWAIRENDKKTGEPSWRLLPKIEAHQC